MGQREGLTVHLTGRQSDIAGSISSHQTILLEQGAALLPVITDIHQLPLQDGSSQIATGLDVNPCQHPDVFRVDPDYTPNGPTRLFDRFNDHGKELRHGIKTILFHPADGSRRVVNRAATTLFKRGYFGGETDLANYLAVVSRSDMRWLAIDSLAALGEFGLTRVLDFAVPTTLMTVMDNKAEAAAFSAAAVGLVNGIVVKESYLILRVGLVEMPYILKEIFAGRMERSALMRYPMLYGGIACTNLLHGLGYAAQPLIGTAHNQQAAQILFATLKNGQVVDPKSLTIPTQKRISRLDKIKNRLARV